MKPNTTFELTVEDINVIDEALIVLQHQRMGAVGFEISQIVDLRAKLFHQKNWYRVKDDRFQGGG